MNLRFLKVLIWAIGAAAGLNAAELTDVPLSKVGVDFRIVGYLNHPFGQTITIQGTLFEGPPKGYEGGPTLQVQSIEGVATQEDHAIPLEPYFGKWETWADEWSPLEAGKSYEVTGFETGAYVGIPHEALQQAPMPHIQTSGHYFRTWFSVVRIRQIPPLIFTPAQFLGRQALFQGIARTRAGRAVMDGESWSALVEGSDGWPETFEGKLVEALGLIERGDTPESFRIVGDNWRLVRLEDQLGRQVELRGIAISLNGEWWFRYLGTDLCVENMAAMPGWTVDHHWCPIVIRGVLDQAMLPRLDQISLKSDRDLRLYYVVRGASWARAVPTLGSSGFLVGG